jgi:hypothetical protein
MKVRFPDGTLVNAVALSERREHDPDRDYALYLDPAWSPTWKADVVAWPDRGLPGHYQTAAQQIWCAFQRARGGEGVEVGCIGGLGRTGTVLACMAILVGVATGEAVQWVRSNYRVGAVETRDQEWWVQWFDAHVHGRQAPPPPPSR